MYYDIRCLYHTLQVLPFEQVWHAFHPHCTFVTKPKKTSVADIICEIEAYQDGEANNSAKLKIAQKYPAVRYDIQK